MPWTAPLAKLSAPDIGRRVWPQGGPSQHACALPNTSRLQHDSRFPAPFWPASMHALTAPPCGIWPQALLQRRHGPPAPHGGLWRRTGCARCATRRHPGPAGLERGAQGAGRGAGPRCCAHAGQDLRETGPASGALCTCCMVCSLMPGEAVCKGKRAALSAMQLADHLASAALRTAECSWELTSCRSAAQRTPLSHKPPPTQPPSWSRAARTPMHGPPQGSCLPLGQACLCCRRCDGGDGHHVPVLSPASEQPRLWSLPLTHPDQPVNVAEPGSELDAGDIRHGP